MLLCESFMQFGYRADADSETERITGPEDMLGRGIRLRLVTGNDIFCHRDGASLTRGDDFSAYDDLRDGSLFGQRPRPRWRKRSRSAYSYSFASVCFVSEAFYEHNRYFDASRRGIQQPAAPRAAVQRHDGLPRGVVERETVSSG